ncbi:MAG: NAD(P)-dependent oxidoreductase [Bacteroidota bacterium]
MIRIGVIRERKTPPDVRVPLTPKRCAHIKEMFPDVKIYVEPSPNRCFKDEDYVEQGIELKEDLSDCDVLIGVKEVPIDHLMEGKTYFFFSHTKKQQPYNKKLMQALISKRIRMIDYECLTHADHQRILGFGFYAGIVGAHNAMLTYGKKHGLYELKPAYEMANYEEMLLQYERLKLPNVKIAVTGSGKVSAGVLDMMAKLDIESVEPEDFLTHEYKYPVYTNLKGKFLYSRTDDRSFHTDDFHAYPEKYSSVFPPYLAKSDILMNGIYWDHNIPRLFEKKELLRSDLRLSVISDITCDIDGSVPINVGASTIADPVYGIDINTFEKVAPFQNSKSIIDIMAVDNLPNELPADASKYFGVQFEKYILGELLNSESDILERATICKNGQLTPNYEYLHDYAYS